MEARATKLYRYKRYTDVRLVFAPEKQDVFFGDDFENDEYPRFAHDIGFLRAYENVEPPGTLRSSWHTLTLL